MKVHRDDHPEMSLVEIKAQIAIGALTKEDLHKIVDLYRYSKYYLPEDVLDFLEKYLGIIMLSRNKFLL
jgi:hypothetical protein